LRFIEAAGALLSFANQTWLPVFYSELAGWDHNSRDFECRRGVFRPPVPDCALHAFCTDMQTSGWMTVDLTGRW